MIEFFYRETLKLFYKFYFASQYCGRFKNKNEFYVNIFFAKRDYKIKILQ